ncbi:MAG: response regulator [Acidobacteriota bacterium]|nr:response regulator [Acidobacteriota bacterium]
MNKEQSRSRVIRSPLRTRLRIYAAVGLAIVSAWLYYTINAVFGLYNTTLAIQRNTELRQQVQDAQNGLSNAEDALARYTTGGQGYDLARHHAGRSALRGALGAIQRSVRTESTRGQLERAEAEEALYAQTADQAIAQWKPDDPAPARERLDETVRPAVDKLREHLTELALGFARSQAFAEERLKDNRDTSSAALGIMAVLLLVGILWLVADVGRRIVTPAVTAARALEEITAGRTPPRLPEQPADEIGGLGTSVNRAAEIFAERGRALEDLDIQASVNAILTVAATVNDLSGFGSATMERILEMTGASSGILYLPEPSGGFLPAVSLGGDEGDGQVGRREAARAAQARKPLFVSVAADTPTVNVLDGRILPRQTAHIPLVYFDHVVGVLGLGATGEFTRKASNALTAIAPSLAVALANASANERVAEQSRRLAEQNELLEEQRSRIARTAEELQRAGALKDRFLASVSHELRTPMTVILGFTGTLLRGNQGTLNAPQRESLERVQRNAKLLLGLINDILDISKIEAGKAHVSPTKISVPAFLAQIQADFLDAAQKKGLALETWVDPGISEVTTDAARLTQIAANLIGNALKFTERGRIEVRAEEKSGGRWALVVSDTGIGIPEEEQRAIFEEFRQGEAPEHRGRGGTGLGLAIVKQLALVLGGTVSLQSARGEGSRFLVTLPRELSTPAAAPAPPPRPATAGERTVLVVDDDESIRRLIAVELGPHGIRVLEASDGQEGVRVAQAERPDLILLDVFMPGLNGWQTLKTLKDSAETRNIPVVVLSVVENRAFGFSLGAFDYLLKPLSRDGLFDVLSRAGVLASRGHVLIVDDERDIRSLLEHELVAAGYRARSVPGGAEALEEIERERPSAVILDLMMPPPDGFEVLYRVRERPEWNGIPVIVLTAKDLSSSDYARLHGSAERILQKGTDPGGIVREVLGVLESARPAVAGT